MEWYEQSGSRLPEYKVGVEMLWQFVDGKVLPIEAHIWEELELVLVVVQNEAALSISWFIYQLDNRLWNNLTVKWSAETWVRRPS